MSNPFAAGLAENARAQEIMGMFWYDIEDLSLQPWTGRERMLHLDTNERSGADTWFAEVLIECREGALSEANYNFLHGYPITAEITYWHHLRDTPEGQAQASLCQSQPYDVRAHWAEWPESQNFECRHCWLERKRRARVLSLQWHPEQDGQRLADPSFANAVLILSLIHI